ncbi:MAG: RNA-binding protein [Nitrososphaerota archaeon]|nr:RNA-binding protein [Nitrososphaerota archaeon]MDG6979117.1 RNA-binding protein [Nitrososphaerota archaeon]MDG7020566.1 RNA-binding protein [Nitrososphaerota archaeon]
MSFEKLLRVPLDRVGALIGKKGETKSKIEESCRVSIAVDGKTGEVAIRSTSLEADPFRATNAVEAIARGFSPQRALKLLDPDLALEILDIREFAGKSENSLERIKGRIIGLHGKSRRVIEELTKCDVSVYGKTVAIIGEPTELRLAKDAIEKLAAGSQHKSVYNMLQRARTKRKMERILLWEDQSPEIRG